MAVVVVVEVAVVTVVSVLTVVTVTGDRVVVISVVDIDVTVIVGQEAEVVGAKKQLQALLTWPSRGAISLSHEGAAVGFARYLEQNEEATAVLAGIASACSSPS